MPEISEEPRAQLVAATVRAAMQQTADTGTAAAIPKTSTRTGGCKSN